MYTVTINENTITFGDIEIEEITIEGSLHTASHNGNPIVEILHVESIAPVDNVQSTVGPEGKEVMRGDGFSLPCLRDHV